jgi:hypothetical protein
LLSKQLRVFADRTGPQKPPVRVQTVRG